MPLWALDFATRTVSALQPEEFASARAAGRFCWIDLEVSDADLWSKLANGSAHPSRLMTELLPELEFADGWLALGLAEVRLDRPRTLASGLNLFFAEGMLLTVDFGGSETLRRIRQTWRDDFLRFAQTPGFFLFEVADHYVTFAQHEVHALEERLEALQLSLFDSANDSVFGEVAVLLQRLTEFRHQMVVVHEAFEELATRSSPFIPTSTQPFLKRNADRMFRIADELQQHREGLVSGLDLYIGLSGHRTGQLLKRLTAFSMIFLPLSFLASVFGMNFTHLPGLDWPWGYTAFWGVSVLIVVGLLVVARKQRWF